jgi:diaminopropionate ammonia-lyase
MAAAVAAHFVAVLGARAPKVIVVEPESAACLQASARADRAMAIPQTASTNMGRLACYAPSAAAWPVLRTLTAAYATVSDAEAESACALLERHDLATTPSSAAGFAALRRVATSAGERARLGLGPDSDALVVITEAPLAESVE